MDSPDATDRAKTYVENNEFIADIHYICDGDESDEIQNYIVAKQWPLNIDEFITSSEPGAIERPISINSGEETKDYAGAGAGVGPTAGPTADCEMIDLTNENTDTENAHR